MSFVTTFIIFAVGAYVVQVLLSLLQVKHFNKVYKELRSLGKVAIGRKAGKIKAGTIVMFAIKDKGKILDARVMQGVTVISKFRQLDQFIGHDIHYIDKYHPLVHKENKLTQEAMEDAREIYLRVSVGNYKEEPVKSPIGQLGTTLNVYGNMLKNKIKGSVKKWT